jgi:hypothetical protein
MAVVINDFESVPASPAPQRSAQSEGGGEGKSSPSEDEIERLMELQESRYERIRAY